MKNRCLYCYEKLKNEENYHKECSSEFFGSATPPQITYSWDQMDELAKNVVERSITVPGVQAKISMSNIKEANRGSIQRLTIVGALGGHYILKPPSYEFPEMPANEHLTMKAAREFGIKVVPSSLVRLASGELAYITKRIDRNEKDEKIHMLDMFQITEAFDKYRSSMEKIGKAIIMYSANTLLDAIRYFELTLFCFVTGNNDMHLKNFSMIEGSSGWLLSPAYDLLNVAILNPNDNEEIALTLEGKKRRLKHQDFQKLGQSLGMTPLQIKRAFGRISENQSKLFELIEKSFLSNEMKENYKKHVKSRYSQLDLTK